jgi:type I restriction enzyme S subunit
MIDDLRPYPEMKEPGLPWLGQVPSHWEVRRNGRLFSERNETGFPDLPILEVSLKTGVRIRDFDNSMRKQVMSDREKYKRARQASGHASTGYRSSVRPDWADCRPRRCSSA